jgi:protoheme IX farnesyltransferase
MSLLSSSANEAVPAGPLHRLIGLYMQLAKARLSALVLLTTAVGFVMGSPGAAGIDWFRLVATVAGTALAAGAANALNQMTEVRRDGLMRRTRGRPLPSRAIGIGHALVFAVLAGYAGLAILALAVNLAAAGLALATICIYVGLYTPLKTRSTLNTLVGAVCGAIPPMIGWVAAAGRLEPGAWILGALLFVWQIPHFFALAWLYREDYARGGFAMLPVVDRTGRLTGQVVVLTSLSLVPLALAATLAGLTGWVYSAGSMVLGLWILGFGARLYTQRTEASARRLFLASIVYLPILLCLMVADRGPVAGSTVGPQAVASHDRQVGSADPDIFSGP